MVELENEIKRLCPEIMDLKFGCWFIFDEIKFLYGSDKNKDEELKEVERGEIEILGRDITLPDILKVLATCDMEFVVDCDGQFLYRTEYEEEGKVECYSRTDVHWNPDEPLHLQSKEVLTFLSKLILKK